MFGNDGTYLVERFEIRVEELERRVEGLEKEVNPPKRGPKHGWYVVEFMDGGKREWDKGVATGDGYERHVDGMLQGDSLVVMSGVLRVEMREVFRLNEITRYYEEER